MRVGVIFLTNKHSCWLFLSKEVQHVEENFLTDFMDLQYPILLYFAEQKTRIVTQSCYSGHFEICQYSRINFQRQPLQ